MRTTGLLGDLAARGLIHDTTDRAGLEGALAAGPITLYAGFDPTAESLHVGNLVPLLTLRRFTEAGHRGIALAGGGTGMIGDPSGKSAERNLLDEETLAGNVAAISGQLAAIVPAAEVVDNRTWLGTVSLIEFLRDIGKHATVNQMVAKESVRARMESESGISYTEFTYMLLQAYDYLVLHERHGCVLQIGGSDQWGNITAGIDLIRRRTGHHVHGLSCPLITRADGRKFGKTEEGTVWLSADRTSPYRFFQYWMNVDDGDVGRFLRIFTFLSLDEIADIESAHVAAPEKRQGHRRLAREMTELVHGPAAALEALEASQILFGGAVEDASPGTLATLAAEVPSTKVDPVRLVEGLTLVDTLVETGLLASRGDARRQVGQGGIYVNGQRQSDDRPLGNADLLHGRWMVLRRGKRDYHLVDVAPG